MFKHNIRTALRHFARGKGVTCINLLCLTFGLACFMLAYALVEFMEGADLYHDKAARTYVVTQRSEFTDALSVPVTGWGFAPLLETDYPALEHVVRASRGAEVAVSSGPVKNFTMVSYADPEFLEVFDFDFVAGDRRGALRMPRSAVINDELAMRWFGTTDVLGTALLLNNRETVRITGVMRRPRQPTHMSTNAESVGIQVFSLLVSSDAWPALRPAAASQPMAPARFFGRNSYTFLVFRERSALTAELVSSDLQQFVKRHVAAQLGKTALDLRPVNELGLVAMDFATRREQTGITMTGVMLTLGLLVLVIACLNYANLATAQATTRLKEIALRRVVGASYRQVVVQAFLEALLLVMIAAALALALMPLLSTLLSSRMGAQVDTLIFNLPAFWVALAITIVGVAVLASSYPALVAARIRPADALHSGRTPVFKVRALRALVVCQFATASFLFVATRVMDAYNDQLLVASAAVGDDAIVVISNDTQEIGVDRRLLQERLVGQPGIMGVSAIDLAPGALFGPSAIISAQADAEARRKMLVAPSVDHGFFAALRIRLLAGRDFDRSIANDTTTNEGLGNVIIDRALAVENGWTPEQAIGKQLYVPSSTAKNAAGRARTIIGVVENHTLYPAKLGSAATLYSLNPERVKAVLVRVSKQDLAGGLRSIDAVWSALVPNVALKRKFMDEQFEASYRQMSAMSDVLGSLAGFALVIATLGLVGIATHAISQRTFEIGVRKTLGASTRQILTLLLRDFSKPILLGNLIAWPLAYGFAQVFNVMYVQRPPSSALPYLTSLLLGLAVAWLAVLRKAVGAAWRPPAAVLRHD